MASSELTLRIGKGCHPLNAAYEREQHEDHLKEIYLAPMPDHPQPGLGCNELVLGASIGATEADMQSRTVVPAVPKPFYDEYDKRLIDEFANESGRDDFAEILIWSTSEQS
jgi:hypothetical protein